MPTSYRESNKLHSTRKREGAYSDLDALADDSNQFAGSIGSAEAEGIRDEYNVEHEDFDDNQ
jgi:hypothetical protein